MFELKSVECILFINTGSHSTLATLVYDTGRTGSDMVSMWTDVMTIMTECTVWPWGYPPNRHSICMSVASFVFHSLVADSGNSVGSSAVSVVGSCDRVSDVFLTWCCCVGGSGDMSGSS